MREIQSKINDSSKEKLRKDSLVFLKIWSGERNILRDYLVSTSKISEINNVISNLSKVEWIKKISENIEIIFSIIFFLWNYIIENSIETADLIKDIQFWNKDIESFFIEIFNESWNLMNSLKITKKIENTEDIEQLSIDNLLLDLWQDCFTYKASINIKTNHRSINNINVNISTLKEIVQFIENKIKESDDFIKINWEKWINIIEELQ